MNITTLEFSSFLTYSPRGTSSVAKESRTVMSDLKNDKSIQIKQNKILTSEYYTQKIKSMINTLSFASYFHAKQILVPVPKSSLTKKNTLWASKCLADALIRNGLGKNVNTCLFRKFAVLKSSMCKPRDRPKPRKHFDSLSMKKIPNCLEEVLLIDDIVTRGSTFLGAANRIKIECPTTKIRAFAFMRTISNSDEFEKIVNPYSGMITIKDNDAFRKP